MLIVWLWVQGVLQIYRHNDMSHLDELLRACPPGRRKLVITDGLFSMDGEDSACKLWNCCLLFPIGGNFRSDELTYTSAIVAGDFADFEGLISLRRKYGFLLAIDEAHATLVCGPR